MTNNNPINFLAHDANFSDLRAATILQVENSYTRGERRFAEFFGRKTDFLEHMNEIKSEFIDRSELLFIHSGLVVALRRRLRTDHFLPLFFRMWREEGDFLRQHLSLRWLISTGDTLVDFGESASQKALALAAVLFVNTIKLHETERHIHSLRDKELEVTTSPGGFLFDGLTCYSISDGDMITNMVGRSRSLVDEDDIAGPLLGEIIRRVAVGPTVFRRFGDLKKAAEADPIRYRKIVGRRTKAALKR